MSTADTYTPCVVHNTLDDIIQGVQADPRLTLSAKAAFIIGIDSLIPITGYQEYLDMLMAISPESEAACASYLDELKRFCYLSIKPEPEDEDQK